MYDPSENAAADIAAHFHSFTNLATHPEVGPLVITKGDGKRDRRRLVLGLGAIPVGRAKVPLEPSQGGKEAGRFVRFVAIAG